MDLEICQFCGNEEAVVATCNNCIAPTPDTIATSIARDLGGEPNDYEWLAQRVAFDLGWPGDD